MVSKNIKTNIHIILKETINIRDFVRLRKLKTGVKKFVLEIISGWRPTKGNLSQKLPEGVNIYREINKEENEYHEIVKDYVTNETVHESHELLTEHNKKHNKNNNKFQSN
jgi:hypothetical protein